MNEWKTKKAGELHDHDVIRGHGMVDWTVGATPPLGDHILVYVHSQNPERRSYTILFSKNLDVEYTRS